MAIPGDTLKTAENSIRTMLNQQFGGSVVFDLVRVEATKDHYGEDNLDIVVVYDSESDVLDADQLNLVSMDLAAILATEGFHNIPTESYIHKREYADWLALKQQPPWERQDG